MVVCFLKFRINKSEIRYFEFFNKFDCIVEVFLVEKRFDVLRSW